MVYKSGQMVPNMRATGRITRLMVKVYFGMSMETNTKDGGSVIKPMDMESTPIAMVPLTKVIGKMTCNTARV